MISKLIDILFSDNGEKSIGIATALLTFFGLDKFLLTNMNHTIIHEFTTGFIKMVFSVITAIIVYFILEYFKNKRNDKNGLKRDIGE